MERQVDPAKAADPSTLRFLLRVISSNTEGFGCISECRVHFVIAGHMTPPHAASCTECENRVRKSGKFSVTNKEEANFN